MDGPTWARIERLFYGAIERAPAERATFLDEACNNDHDLRREVEALLQHHTRTGDLFGSARELARDLRRFSSEPPLAGRPVGPYRIEREIGAGGMGRVFLAHREDLPKRVALKLVREPLASPDRIARFHFERRILAGLDHPHIAQLLDAGVTDDGAPYFAMEYVDGEPLSTFCDRRHLAVAERLRLFLDVCAAVRYAHAHLIVHRDIKPSNILVTDDGGVKLLDFGVAKLLTPTGETELTRTGARVFTPNYAAPEQLAGEPVTTATDVYQLGGLLYELLAGRPPLDLDGASQGQAERIIIEREPAPPSVAAPRFGHRLRGDLDNIVLKALEKRPERRYASVEALAADVERFLDNRPVHARQTRLPEHLWKFVRRNRVTAGVIAGVIVYALTVTLGAVGVARERDRAEREAATARLQATKSDQVIAFLLGLFEASDPSVAQGDTLTARELLARGVERADAFAEQPEVQATLLAVMGRSRFNLGDADEAAALFQQAVDIWESVPEPDREALAEVQLALAETYVVRSHFEESSAIYRALSEGEGDALAAIRSDALFGLFTSLHGLRRHEAADSAFDLWAAAIEGAPARPDPRTAREMVRFGQVLQYRGDGAKAELILRRGIQYNRALYGDRHPNLGNALNALGALLVNDSTPQAGAADSVTRESVTLHRGLDTERHPQLALALSLRARFLRSQDRLAEAEALLREALALETPSPGRDGLGFVTRNRQLAQVLAERGAYDDAISRFRTVSNWWERNFGPDYLYAHHAKLDLAAALTGRGAYPEAERLLRASHERLRTARGSDDASTQRAVEHLVALYEAWGDPEAGDRYRQLLVRP